MNKVSPPIPTMSTSFLQTLAITRPGVGSKMYIFATVC